jgi:hypothetical protein
MPAAADGNLLFAEVNAKITRLQLYHVGTFWHPVIGQALNDAVGEYEVIFHYHGATRATFDEPLPAEPMTLKASIGTCSQLISEKPGWQGCYHRSDFRETAVHGRDTLDIHPKSLKLRPDIFSPIGPGIKINAECSHTASFRFIVLSEAPT